MAKEKMGSHSNVDGPPVGAFADIADTADTRFDLFSHETLLEGITRNWRPFWVQASAPCLSRLILRTLHCSISWKSAARL